MGSSVPHHRKKATVPLLYGQQHLLGLQHAENIMAIRYAFAKKQIQMIASCQFFDLTGYTFHMAPSFICTQPQ